MLYPESEKLDRMSQNPHIWQWVNNPSKAVLTLYLQRYWLLFLVFFGFFCLTHYGYLRVLASKTDCVAIWTLEINKDTNPVRYSEQKWHWEKSDSEKARRKSCSENRQVSVLYLDRLCPKLWRLTGKMIKSNSKSKVLNYPTSKYQLQ